jgi:sulfatase maturation enzyme AslB (radical SAM superfamily)
MFMTEPIYCTVAQAGLSTLELGFASICNQHVDLLRKQNGEYYRLHKDSIQDAWNSQERKKVIEEMNAGIWPKGCEQCRVAEANGYSSQRLDINSEVAELAEKEKIKVEPRSDQPIAIVLKHGNVCNNACRTCHPTTSTKWYKDSHKMEGSNLPLKDWIKQNEFNLGQITYDENNKDIRNVFFGLDNKSGWNENVIFWDLYGGEPLLNNLTFELLDHSIAIGVANRQRFGIHTNCSIYNQDFVNKLPNFAHVNLGLSLDATGERNDYIRHLSKWPVVEGVVQQYFEAFKEHDNVTPTITITQQILNIFYMPETFDYIAEKGWAENYGTGGISWGNKVYDKKECNIHYLPEPIKKVVKKKLLEYKPNGRSLSIDWHNEVDQCIAAIDTHPDDYEEHRDTFWKVNNRLDKIRGQSFKETMPEYHSLFEEYYKGVNLD